MYGIGQTELIALICIIAIPIWSGILASKKNRSVIGWTLLSLLFFPAIIILLCISPLNGTCDKNNNENANQDLRECPYCAEPIRKAAKVCKHCKRDVEPMDAVQSMLCPNCQAGIPVGSTFCPHCKKAVR